MALTKEIKERLVKDFGQGPKDSGSAEVQVAMLTENIRQLTDHCKKNPQDFSSRRGLLKMVCRRRRYLDYLLRKDKDVYAGIIKELGLKR